jgi:hypothetical protein
MISASSTAATVAMNSVKDIFTAFNIAIKWRILASQDDQLTLVCSWANPEYLLFTLTGLTFQRKPRSHE